LLESLWVLILSKSCCHWLWAFICNLLSIIKVLNDVDRFLDWDRLLAYEICTLCKIAFRSFQNRFIFLIIYIIILFSRSLYRSKCLFFLFQNLLHIINSFSIALFLISLFLLRILILKLLFSFILIIKAVGRIFDFRWSNLW